MLSALCSRLFFLWCFYCEKTCKNPGDSSESTWRTLQMSGALLQTVLKPPCSHFSPSFWITDVKTVAVLRSREASEARHWNQTRFGFRVTENLQKQEAEASEVRSEGQSNVPPVADCRIASKLRPLCVSRWAKFKNLKVQV